MSRMDELTERYERHIGAPWLLNLAGAQRVIFAVYPKEDERRLRIKLRDFQQRTVAAGHLWRELDLTDAFPAWMAREEYRDEYFQSPEDLHALGKLDADFANHCALLLRDALTAPEVTDNTVVAVHGVGALFGFTRLHFILQKIESDIRGRLLVFFPGAYEQNAYRLLDARDGWNYLATPITCSA